MRYVFLAVLIVALVIVPAIKFLKFRWLSPTILMSAIMILSSLSAGLGLVAGWNSETTLDVQVYFIILLGLISFMVGEFIAKTFFRGRKKSPKKEKYAFKDAIIVKKWKYVIIFALFLVTIILVWSNLAKICNQNECGAKDLPSMINFYRKNSALFFANGITFDTITTQLLKICNLVAIIFSYVFIKNLLVGKKITTEWKNLLVVILAIMLGVMQSGGRAPLLKYFTIFAMSFGIISIYELNKGKDFYIRWGRRVLVLALVILLVFYFSLPLTGRSTNQGFLSYITFYLGSPIPSLNHFIMSGMTVVENGYFGENLFYGIYRLFNTLGLTSNYKAISLPFIWFDSMGSNVFTGFFRYYLDFNLWGVVLGSMACGAVMGKLFELATEKKNIRYVIFFLIYVPNLADFFRDDFFFRSFVSTTTIADLIILWATTWLLFSENTITGLEKQNEGKKLT